jgi:hypothetical protein
MRTDMLTSVSALVMVGFLDGAGVTAQDRSQFREPLPRARLLTPSGLDGIVWKVRSLDRIEYRIGFTLTPGEFHRLAQECRRHGSPDDFRRLLLDPSPLVRVLGLVCFRDSVDARDFASVAVTMAGDKVVVKYTDGCILDASVAVDDIARRLVDR